MNLDDFMKLMWQKYGKTEKAYEIKDLDETLAEYAGKEFAEDFFDNYIYSSKMPDYEALLANIGLKLERASKNAFFGATLRDTPEGVEISRNLAQNTPAYKAGLNQGDVILSVDGVQLEDKAQFEELLKAKKPGEKLEFGIQRFGKQTNKEVTLSEDPTYSISIDEKASAKAIKAREAWLSKR